MTAPLHDSGAVFCFARTDSLWSPLVKREEDLNQSATAQLDPPISARQLERRGNPRATISVDTETTDLSTGTSLAGSAVDLGFGGCFVETEHPFPVGTKVRLHFGKKERGFRCIALVTHSLQGRGMGLVFTEADPLEELSVLEWVTSVGGVTFGRGLSNH